MVDYKKSNVQYNFVKICDNIFLSLSLYIMMYFVLYITHTHIYIYVTSDCHRVTFPKPYTYPLLKKNIYIMLYCYRQHFRVIWPSSYLLWLCIKLMLDLRQSMCYTVLNVDELGRYVISSQSLISDMYMHIFSLKVPQKWIQTFANANFLNLKKKTATIC